MPSSAAYLVAAVALAVALFIGIWWALVTAGDEAPWIPAGLAASVVLLVALSAREVVMRRAWTRYLLEQGIQRQTGRRHAGKGSLSRRTYSSSLLAAALRAIQKKSAEADVAGSVPESHLELFHLCEDYLTTTDDALQGNNLPLEKRIAIRAGQDRARGLQRHHLLSWAKDSSLSLTHEAQQRARTFDKIDTANRALDCLDTALKAYPEEQELHQSRYAIQEFIVSVKVAHWVELAERAAFKGHFRRAIQRYKDALFYLDRETLKDEARVAGIERISQEIELLRARLKSDSGDAERVKNEKQGVGQQTEE